MTSAQSTACLDHVSTTLYFSFLNVYLSHFILILYLKLLHRIMILIFLSYIHSGCC